MVNMENEIQSYICYDTFGDDKCSSSKNGVMHRKAMYKIKYFPDRGGLLKNSLLYMIINETRVDNERMWSNRKVRSMILKKR